MDRRALRPDSFAAEKGAVAVKREPEFFGDTELDLLYLARRLREALKLEKLLTEAGLDYLVQTGPYVSGFLIKRELTGAYFYVAPRDLSRAKEVLTGRGYKPFNEQPGG
jgi:hypothetical protein